MHNEAKTAGMAKALSEIDDEIADHEGQKRWRKRKHDDAVPLWAACAVTGLAVTVVALCFGCCCFYRHHNKTLKAA